MRVYTHPKYKYVRVAEIPRDEITKIHFDVCKQPRETLDSYYKRQVEKPSVIVNAGFFNMNDGTPCFNYISDGKVWGEDVFYKWGIGVVGNKDISYGAMNEKSWNGWITGFPPLVYNGSKMDIIFGLELNYKARRTILGFNDSTVYLVCIESPGMRYSTMQDLMINLGATYAINLDGGGSTRMLHNGVAVTKDVIANRPVDNVIAVYTNNVQTEKTPSALSGLSVGDKVKVLKNNIYGSSKTFKLFYKEYEVLAVNGDRVVIGINNIITAPVHKNNLQKI